MGVHRQRTAQGGLEEGQSEEHDGGRRRPDSGAGEHGAHHQQQREQACGDVQDHGRSPMQIQPVAAVHQLSGGEEQPGQGGQAQHHSAASCDQQQLCTAHREGASSLQFPGQTGRSPA